MKPYEYQSPAERKARAMIHERPTLRLIADWELLKLLPPTVENIAAGRWIADELEARNPEAFEAWEGETFELESPRSYFLPA